MSQAFNATAECAAAGDFPNLRVMSLSQIGADTPQFDLGTVRLPWSRASSDSICGGDFDHTSAVGYFFARDLHKALGENLERLRVNAGSQAGNATGGGTSTTMPVGLIVSSVPGTPIEKWAEPKVLKDCNIDKKDSKLWNGMIVPLLQVSIRGAIWYSYTHTTLF